MTTRTTRSALYREARRMPASAPASRWSAYLKARNKWFRRRRRHVFQFVGPVTEAWAVN
jgi:hypothetical protein